MNVNTLFKHHPRRLITWTLLNGKYKNQIDYCLILLRWISNIKNTKTKPGVDYGCDHQLLVAKKRIHLKTNKRHQQKPSQHIYDKNKWESSGAILQQNIR